MPTEFQVRVTRRAKADIDEIWTFIAHDSVTDANRFIYQLERQLKKLRRFPERCPLIPENESSNRRYRHLLYGKYRTIFFVSGGIVRVLRVIHGSRLLDITALDL